MEEVWEDINLASLNEQNIGGSGRSNRHSNLGGVMFQDFLGRPLNTIHPPNTILSSASSQTPPSIYCTASPAPLTALSLSSRPNQFHFDPLTPKPSHPPSSTPSPLLHTFSTKSFPQPPPDCSFGDRRNKRMIKNRESAARSRARKQAYTNELELKVELLREENARLRRQQQQLSEAAAASQQKKKGTLYRTSTAPF